jgi:preprotein translocase subunit SecA
MVKYSNNPNYILDEFSISELQLYLFNEFCLTYQELLTECAVYGEDTCQNFQRTILLTNIDLIWREHLQKMSLLREAVGWRGYGQRNPLYEYKKEAFTMFKEQKKVFRQLVIYDLLRSSVL